MADRTVNVKLQADVAQYMASMRAAGGATKDLEKAARDVRKAHDEEADAAGRVRVAEAKLNDLRADSKAKVSQLAAAEEQLAKAHRTLEVAQDKTSAATARFTQVQAAAGDVAGQSLGDGVAGGIDKSSGKVDEASDRLAKRTNAKFSALTFAGLSVGLPAAAAVGAAGAGIALAAVPALFVGIGVAAVAGNERVKSSFNGLATMVVQDTQRMAASLAGPVANAAVDLGASFDRLEPQITAAFNGSAPAVKILTTAVTDFAESAMPGVVVAVQSSKAPLEGLRSLAGQVGSGVTDMFTNLSAGSVNAGRGLSTLGGIVRDAEGFLGSLFANVANGSAGPLSALQAMLRQAESALLAVTATGSGAIGFLTGFTSGATGMLSILTVVTRLLSALPPQVTQFAGSMVASGMLLSKVGVDAGAGFAGLGDKISAAKGAGDKFKTALSGLADGALHPAMLATAGLALGLQILGQAQADAAAKAQAHQERVNNLASALRQSNGVIDENVRKTAGMALQDFNAGDGKRNLIKDVQDLLGDKGITMLTDAYLGNTDAGALLTKQVHDLAVSHTGVSGEMDATATKALDLEGILGDTTGVFGQAVEKNKQLTVASTGTRQATTELSAAMEVLRGTAASTSERVTALKTALDILSGRTPTFEEGIQAGNDQLRSFADGLKNGVTQADGFGKALLNADGTVNTFTKNGSSLQDLATGLQTSFVNAASGIDEMVRRGVPFDQATRRVNDGLTEQRNRFIDVAEKMGLSSIEAGKLADKYGLIPSDVATLVTANTKRAEEAIKALPELAANTAGAVVISADVDKATGKITSTVQYADGSVGVITIDGNRDKATGKVNVAVQYANGQHSYMNIDAFNQAAKDRTIEAKRMADGTVAWIIVGADTGRANTAIDDAARTRYSTIQVRTVVTGPNTSSQTGRYAPAATGGLITRQGVRMRGFAGGGATFLDVTAGGLMSGPGGPRDDRIPVLVSNREFVNNAASTERNLAALDYANRGGTIVPDFASSVQQSIQTGAAVTGAPVVTSQSSSGSNPSGGTEVRVFIGDQELTSIVRTEIRQKDRQTRRAVTAGAGAAR